MSIRQCSQLIEPTAGFDGRWAVIRLLRVEAFVKGQTRATAIFVDFYRYPERFFMLKNGASGSEVDRTDPVSIGTPSKGPAVCGRNRRS